MPAFVFPVLILSVATLAARVVSRRLRPGDASLWHAASVTLAVVALSIPLLAFVPPFIAILPIPASESAQVMYSTLASPAASRVAWWLGAIYFAGVLFVVARFLFAAAVVGRMRRHSRTLTSLEAARITAVAPHAAARCRVHRTDGPATIGLWRPQIVLPEEWTGWSPDRLAAVLNHERAHVARRDPLWHAVAALQQAMYWPSPLSWWLAREIRTTAEIAADQIAAGEDRPGYAVEVIALAEEWLDRRVSAADALAPSAASNLPARVDALLNDTVPHPQASRTLKIATVAVLLLTLLAPATVRVVRPSPQMAHAHKHTH